ncbi:Eco57I restriction-modification methylase domain-containing protein [Nocardia puris]|uniref:Eco57I restriction-modification methylase domain-containing protein n=1 Tax=Nocardia puris TaxID=208602 RepID=UPI001E369FA1|nr:N-6 DNA methylase [Nocardia puris]
MGARADTARERKRHGRHYTPPALARFLAQRVLTHAARGATLRVLDPACGDGELLLAVHREVAARRPGARLELVGYDLDESGLAEAAARAERLGVEAEWRAGDFLTDADDLAPGSFDVIITNPPYVRTQQLGGATAQLLSKRFGLRGRIDLTHPFVAVAPRLLGPGGALGLLCANRFLTTKAGANIRSILLTELSPVELYDLGDTKLFTAAVLPAVTIATRAPAAGPCRHVSAYETPSDEKHDGSDLFEALLGDEDRLVRHDGRTFAIEVGTLSTGATKRAHTRTPPRRGTGGNGEPSPGRVRAEVLAHEPNSPNVPGAADTLDATREASHGARSSRQKPPTGSAGARAGATTSGRISRIASVDARAGDAVNSQGGEAYSSWRMSSPSVDAWLARVAASTWRTFGEVGRIRVGIKTTADRVFISDGWARVRPRPEPELLLALLTHRDLSPWRITRATDTRVLYPYDTNSARRVPIDLREFPRAAAYLRKNESTLAAREYLTGSGREWFEIWVPQRPNLWRVPKVVFPDISDRPRFALDRSGAVVNGDCYWISFADLALATPDPDHLAHLLIAVANSALGLRFYDTVCGNRLYSGRRRWITQYVARLPLPDPTTPLGAEIAALGAELTDGPRTPDADTRAHLDTLVSAAFGLPPAPVH